ncbi:MAG: NINE protein [Microthrixaceae bacterium]
MTTTGPENDPQNPFGVPAAPQSAAPGWYPDGSGVTRWWDGHHWGQAAPTSPTPPSAVQSPYQATHSGFSSGPPTPPWGSWVWPNGEAINTSTLPAYDSNKKVTAGILALLLGGLGVHKFYLGYTTEGIIMILLLFCGISPLIGLIEGIIYLTKSDPEFYWTYEAARKTWF